jgi:hypothetical protein
MEGCSKVADIVLWIIITPIYPVYILDEFFDLSIDRLDFLFLLQVVMTRSQQIILYPGDG